MTYSFVFIYIFPPATGTQLGVGASLGATSTRDAAALNLAGCCYAGLGDRGTAATFFERAVIAAPYGNFFIFYFDIILDPFSRTISPSSFLCTGSTGTKTKVPSVPQPRNYKDALTHTLARSSLQQFSVAAHAPCGVLSLGAHAYRMLIGACNPML